MKTIRISADVWEALKQRAVPLEDTPDAVLRRVLGISGERSGHRQILRGQHTASEKTGGRAFAGETGSSEQGEKFDAGDRKVVVSYLESRYKTLLRRIRPSQKLFKAQDGRYYLISGGYGLWHGINLSLQKLLMRHPDATTLIVVHMRDGYRIYMNETDGIAKITKNMHLLSYDKATEQRKFNLVEDGDQLVVKELPDLRLDLIDII